MLKEEQVIHDCVNNEDNKQYNDHIAARTSEMDLVNNPGQMRSTTRKPAVQKLQNSANSLMHTPFSSLSTVHTYSISSSVHKFTK